MRPAGTQGEGRWLRRRFHGKAWVPFVGVLSVLAAGGAARSAEWAAEPSLSVKGEYNSNLLIFSGNNEVWGHWVSPGLTIQGATESLEVASDLKADVVRYYGKNDRSLTNLFAPLRAAYRWDRVTVGFNGGFVRDNTLMGELRQTGLVLGFTQRNLWTAMPSVTVGLTERLSWQAGYQFMDATYQDGFRLGLVDYRVHGGNSALVYRPTERDEVGVNAELVQFDTPAIRQEFTYYGGGVRLSHAFDESLKLTGSFGVRRVESLQRFLGGTLRDRTLVWLFAGEVRKEFERTVVAMSASREVNPSGFGFLLQTDRIGGNLTHRLTDTVTFSLEGAMYRVDFSTSPLLGAGFPAVRFASVSPQLSWQFAQWWTLGVGYTYAERTVAALNQWNFSNATFVMLTYRGDKWGVSR